MFDSNVVLVEESNFFAPVSSDMVGGLVGRYRKMRGVISQVGEVFTKKENASALSYFFKGNIDRSDRIPDIDRVFNETGAVSALNSAYWSETLALTDVYDAMPQKRRDEWNEQIRECKTPDFEEETVRATLTELLMSRSKFFAERVDGIFQKLSRTHVTNQPEGFSKRMIISNVCCTFGYPDSSRCGYINDLRAVISKFMGTEAPDWNASYAVVEYARENPGKWFSIDGGALRIRCYMVGTAHLEVHPDMAWRLNGVLASLYPAAIPASFRTRPKSVKKNKSFTLIQRPLPHQVTYALHEMLKKCKRQTTPVFNTYFSDRIVGAEVLSVLRSIGGVVNTNNSTVDFDYDPRSVIQEIVCSGCIPDHKSHQFYPSPERIAKEAIELADIGDTDICLEPQAGQGGCADFMPKDRTTCVEISSLHCEVLKAKGHSVVCADFLKWAEQYPSKFDRVVMNPPFSDGRWQLHLAAAAKLVRRSGRLVAILPASARNQDPLPSDWKVSWHGPYTNEFDGTGVSVVILTADLE